MCWRLRSSPERTSSSPTIYGIFPTTFSVSTTLKRSTPINLSVTSLDLTPVLVVDAVRDQQARLINPPVSMNELFAIFEQLGLVETVAELRRLMER